MNLESIAAQDYTCNVLAYVMHITFDCRKQDLRPFSAFVILSHIWLENANRIPHDLSRFDYLREEHLALSEELSDGLHACHERAFYYVDCAGMLVEDFLQICLKVL